MSWMEISERSVIGGVAATAVSPFVEFYNALTPYIVFAIILIVADARFGIAAARKRGETIRPSRKWRRAINKLVDYICWASLAGVFGNTYGGVLGVPTLTAIVMLVVYAIELSSIFNNYFEYKGLHIRISLFKAIELIWQKAFKVDTSGIIEKKDNDHDVE